MLDNDRVLLEKRDFQIQVEGEVGQGVLVGTTFDDAIYYGAIGVSDNESIDWFANTGMAEELYNNSKSIIVNDEAPSYWFYSSKDEHRFDEAPVVIKNIFIGTRSIANIAALDPYRLVPLDQLDDDLFIVFYQVEYGERFEERVIHDINGFHVVWTD